MFLLQEELALERKVKVSVNFLRQIRNAVEHTANILDDLVWGQGIYFSLISSMKNILFSLHAVSTCMVGRKPLSFSGEEREQVNTQPIIHKKYATANRRVAETFLCPPPPPRSQIHRVHKEYHVSNKGICRNALVEMPFFPISKSQERNSYLIIKVQGSNIWELLRINTTLWWVKFIEVSFVTFPIVCGN